MAVRRKRGVYAASFVICSPSSRSSPYVGGEIAKFATLRGKENIVPVLFAGIPNNEPSATDEQRAFHDELVSRLPVPLASDYRGWEDKRDRVIAAVKSGAETIAARMGLVDETRAAS